MTYYFSLFCLSGIQAGLGWVVASNGSWVTLCCVQMVAGLSWKVWEDFTYMSGTLVFQGGFSPHEMSFRRPCISLLCGGCLPQRTWEFQFFHVSSKSGLEWHFWCHWSDTILTIRASHRAGPDSRKEELDSVFFFFFGCTMCSMWDLISIPQPGIEPMSAAMEVLEQWNLNHWTTSVVLRLYILMEGVACTYNGERHWWWPPSETIHHTQWAENLNFGKIETKCFKADPGWRKDSVGGNTINVPLTQLELFLSFLESETEIVKSKDLIIRVHYDIARTRPSCSGFW